MTHGKINIPWKHQHPMEGPISHRRTNIPWQHRYPMAGPMSHGRTNAHPMAQQGNPPAAPARPLQQQKGSVCAGHDSHSSHRDTIWPKI